LVRVGERRPLALGEAAVLVVGDLIHKRLVDTGAPPGPVPGRHAVLALVMEGDVDAQEFVRCSITPLRTIGE
jgi:hypothetical protein